MAVEFEGIDKIVAMFENLEEVSNLKQAMGKACAIVERDAKKKAPKDTGELRRSIKSKVEENEQSIEGVVYTPLEYAPYVEYGTGLFAEEGNGRKDVPWIYKDEDTGEKILTSGQKPQPYLRPALYDNREQILELLGGGIGNG